MTSSLPDPAESRDPALEPHRGRGGIGLLPLVALFCAALVALHACGGGLDAVPPELIGTWTTPVPKMKDRYLQFTDQLVIFGTGATTKDIHRIVRIDLEGTKEGKTLYTLAYKDAHNERWTLALFYDAASGGTIQLENRTEVWHRSS
jgi:hypothetical protein